MSEFFQIQMANDQKNFQPGETIQGELAVLREPAKTDSIEIRLLWHTRGKGDRDVEVVATQHVDRFSEGQAIPFQFKAPSYPNSFSLKLVSLVWVIEAIAFPSRDATNQEIVISPTAEIIRTKSSVSWSDEE